MWGQVPFPIEQFEADGRFELGNQPAYARLRQTQTLGRGYPGSRLNNFVEALKCLKVQLFHAHPPYNHIYNYREQKTLFPEYIEDTKLQYIQQGRRDAGRAIVWRHRLVFYQFAGYAGLTLNDR